VEVAPEAEAVVVVVSERFSSSTKYSLTSTNFSSVAQLTLGLFIEDFRRFGSGSFSIEISMDALVVVKILFLKN